MTETQSLVPSDAEQNQREPADFNLDVKIGALPYVFTGELPIDPAGFDLVVRLPDITWTNLKPTVDELAQKNSFFARQYQTLQTAQHLGEGRVGSVWIKPATTKDGAPAIAVSRIQTDSRYLPEESPYQSAKGVGSFILDNLCALADVRGWRIYLEPLERDGRLTGTDLIEWYERRGFGFDSDDDEQMSSPAGSMLRLPKPVDMSQPITQVLA